MTCDQKTQNIKLKQYCNKFNKDFKKKIHNKKKKILENKKNPVGCFLKWSGPQPNTLITVINQASVSNITPSSCHRNPLLVPVFVQSRVHSPETNTLSDLEEKDKQHRGQAWPQARSTEAGWAVLSAKGNSHHPPTGMRARNPYFPQLLNGILRGRSLFLSRPLSWA